MHPAPFRRYVPLNAFTQGNLIKVLLSSQYCVKIPQEENLS